MTRWFPVITALLLIAMGAFEITTARLENATVDEPVHLVAGYSILRQRRFSLNAENPAFAKTLCAAPLLFLGAGLPPDPAGGWQDENSVSIWRPFFYGNRLPPDTLLFWGRMPTILATLVFGLVLALWTRRRFGPVAALIALALFCFDPNIIAHGRYVTSDLWASLFYFTATICWIEFLDGQRTRMLILAGVLAGLGVSTKFNMLALVPLFAILAARRFSLKYTAAVCGVMAVSIYAAYGFETRTVSSDEPVMRFFRQSSQEIRQSTLLPKTIIPIVDPATRAGQVVHWAVRHVPIPAYSWFKGVYRLYNHAYFGHPAYLLGKTSQKGWWYYFPVAFAVKTTTGVLLMMLCGLVFRPRFGKGVVSFWMLAIPAVFYFGVSMTSSINIGLRHILPVYAFLYVIIGVVVSRMERLRWAAAVLILAAVAESAAAYPNYLAFFNVPSGGSRNGPRYLVDSNIDWGQDLLKLKAWMERRQVDSVCLAYFGAPDPDYYHIRHTALREGSGKCVAAISVTLLYQYPEFAWLRQCRPVDRIGYSINIYELPCH